MLYIYSNSNLVQLVSVMIIKIPENKHCTRASRRAARAAPTRRRRLRPTRATLAPGAPGEAHWATWRVTMTLRQHRSISPLSALAPIPTAGRDCHSHCRRAFAPTAATRAARRQSSLAARARRACSSPAASRGREWPRLVAHRAVSAPTQCPPKTLS